MTFNKAKALRQAEKHVQQGKINAAIEDYQKIAESDPSDLTVVNTLGDLLVRAGRVEEAVVNFTKIAESYRENGFTLKAIAMFKKISKLNPQDVEISLKLAALYSQQGLLVEARQQYLQVADSHARSGKTQKALEVYQKIADLDPENTAVRMKLAETYLRENMRDQAHDAYVAAGTELIRKNRVDQGLNACLQALTINPESLMALSAISEAYIFKNEPNRAIELLKEAFDKNPGDVELIAILGRTYLSANMMPEAESAFTTLVQLDKSRYEYVLEVGRTYASLGQIDRAAEQLDACIDILISRREEDRAIDFLHGLLDKNLHHVPSLQRLADIYQRIREDHNLISTLESLVEAAVRSGQTVAAIDALKQLVRLEPENPSHRQRLQSLGVRTEDISSTPTGPFAPVRRPGMEAAPGADPTIERDISDAARMARGGDTLSAMSILEQLVDRAPDSIEGREHLRQIYASQHMHDRASEQAAALARLFASHGDMARAREMEELAGASASSGSGFGTGFGGFEASPPAGGGFDLGFGDFGAPAADPAPPPQPSNDFNLSNDFSFGSSNPFDFSSPTMDVEPPPPVVTDTGSLMTDSALRDELEGVDFYIAQGYLEIARDTLDRLEKSFPNHPDITRRYQKLKSTADLKAQVENFGMGEIIEQATEERVESEFDLSSMFELGDAPPASGSGTLGRDTSSPLVTRELTPPEGGGASPSGSIDLSAAFSIEPPAPAPPAPPVINLEPSIDLTPSFGFSIDGFDVSEPAPPPSAPPPPPVVVEPEPISSNDDLLDNLLGELDDLVGAIEVKPTPQGATPAPPVAPVAPQAHGGFGVSDTEESDGVLQDIFAEFKSSFDQDAGQDYDTHYNLGIAYRDMELLDDAIEEFQAAIRTTSPLAPDGRYIQCCNMLGLCFMSKGMPKLAAKWFSKGIDTPNRPEDEYQALRFDLGLAYEGMGDIDKALDVFSEVYAIDINYRDVSEKLRELQALKNK